MPEHTRGRELIGAKPMGVENAPSPKTVGEGERQLSPNQISSMDLARSWTPGGGISEVAFRESRRLRRTRGLRGTRGVVEGRFRGGESGEAVAGVEDATTMEAEEPAGRLGEVTRSRAGRAGRGWNSGEEEGDDGSSGVVDEERVFPTTVIFFTGFGEAGTT